eukprot:jgi/Tetstr1/444280/TSEL_032171.t1
MQARELVAQLEKEIADTVARRVELRLQTNALRQATATSAPDDHDSAQDDAPCVELLRHTELSRRAAAVDRETAELRARVDRELEEEDGMRRAKEAFFADKAAEVAEKQRRLAEVEGEIAQLQEPAHRQPLLDSIEDLKDQTQLAMVERERLLDALESAKRGRYAQQAELAQMERIKSTDLNEIRNKISDAETRLVDLLAEERELGDRIDEQQELNVEKQQALEERQMECGKLQTALSTLAGGG